VRGRGGRGKDRREGREGGGGLEVKTDGKGAREGGLGVKTDGKGAREGGGVGGKDRREGREGGGVRGVKTDVTADCGMVSSRVAAMIAPGLQP
jgi:hypothetical protein